MNVSSIAPCQIFEGVQRIILRQPVLDFVSDTPQGFRDRLKFSGFAIRMPNEQVVEMKLEKNQQVDLKAEFVMGTTLGGNGNAPLIELAGTTVTAGKKAATKKLPW